MVMLTQRDADGGRDAAHRPYVVEIIATRYEWSKPPLGVTSNRNLKQSCIGDWFRGMPADMGWKKREPESAWSHVTLCNTNYAGITPTYQCVFVSLFVLQQTFSVKQPRS